MKKFLSFSLLLIFCVFLSFYSVNALAAAQAKENTSSIKVPADTPRLKLLGAEFILVEKASLSESLDVMRQRWRDIQASHNNDLFNTATIPLKGQHKSQWQALVGISKKSSDPLKTLRMVNGFYNRLASRKDEDFYGIGEYWATPLEFLTNRSGDCEDYAIIKYFALQFMGWNPDKLWVVFLRENIRNSGHAVLVAESKRGQFVLDNLSKPEHLLIPAKQYAKQVTPFALANDQGLWLRINAIEKPKNTAQTHK